MDQPPCSVPASRRELRKYLRYLPVLSHSWQWLAPQRLNYTRNQKTRMNTDAGDRDRPLRAQRQVDREERDAEETRDG